MGTYTQFRFKVTLIKDIPIEITDLLTRIIINKDLGLGNKSMFHTKDVFIPNIKHKFFECDRWYMLFLSGNFDDTKYSLFTKSKYNYKLELNTEFKNYDDEIEHFINWIKPYIKGRKKKQFIGCYKTEGCNTIYLYK